MTMEQYFTNLRSKIGHEEIIMPGVVGILFDESRTKILMEQRNDGSSGWSFVGGMMNLGESASQTIIREFQEETGLIVKVNKLLGIDTKFHHTFPNGDKAQIPGIVFEVSKVSGQLKPDEESSVVEFVEPTTDLKMYNQQHQRILEHLVKGDVPSWFD
ncbi:MAG: NUDIX domain-containing protein [Lactobacillaceae bacterium]|jgi:8-oxo-dGTP pyrophosphatase MutT (NUDIX family)|nr:NUDIX domain-containing protein [Lactobacillaceae bacterium]